MLPFLKTGLKKQQNAGVIVVDRKPDQPESSDDQDSGDAALEACAHDLIEAVHSKNIKKVAQVLKDTFDMLESMPHEEGEHTNETSQEEPGE